MYATQATQTELIEENYICYQSDIYLISMTEVQILFRLDKNMVDELDKHLADYGFKTRNEWFRAKVREYVTKAEKKRMMEKLKNLSVDDISEDDIVQMVNDWRKGKGKGN